MNMASEDPGRLERWRRQQRRADGLIWAGSASLWMGALTFLVLGAGLLAVGLIPSDSGSDTNSSGIDLSGVVIGTGYALAFAGLLQAGFAFLASQHPGIVGFLFTVLGATIIGIGLVNNEPGFGFIFAVPALGPGLLLLVGGLIRGAE